MPIVTTEHFICDNCGREPGRSQESIAEGLQFGLGTDDEYDRILYGWVAVSQRHLTRSGMGHNGIPDGEIVLCSDCRPVIQQLWQRERKQKETA